MNGWNDIEELERRLKTSIVSLNKRKVNSPTLIEAIDHDGLWPGDFEDIATWLPARSDIESLLRRAPLFLCAAATEIGFRYEGVGTVFWDRLCAALKLTISFGQRQQIADVFKATALKYKLAEPAKTAFAQHFSLIAWPISQALLPIDLIDPVMRMLASAPSSALPAPGRPGNFTTLRAWSSAVEGVRLTDWLRAEEPAERVLAALLQDNKGSQLSQATYRRIADRISQSRDGPVSLRRARSRVTKTRIEVREDTRSLGRLTLISNGNLKLFVTWPALPNSVYEEARLQARSAGWRPRLWKAGPFLHPDNALSGGPFSLSMADCPAALTQPYGDIGQVFADGSDIVRLLTGRTIGWTSLLLFDVNDDRHSAEQRLSPFYGHAGRVFIGSRVGATPPGGLRAIGRLCGYDFFEADLKSADDIAALRRVGAWTERASVVVARHPDDAIGCPPNVVRPGNPFVVFDSSSLENLPEPQTADRPGALKATGIARLRCEKTEPVDAGLITVMAPERDRFFAAIVERRAEIRLESTLSLRNLDVRAHLMSGETLLAVGRMTVAGLPATLDASAPLFAPLLDDRARAALLAAGRGALFIYVAEMLVCEIELQRSNAMVIWGDDGRPQLADQSQDGRLVAADAGRPHLFLPVEGEPCLKDGVAAYGLELSDRRMAEPIRIRVPARIGLGDLSADFGSDVSRRLFDAGLGVADIALAKLNWSRAIGDGLLFTGVKQRVVRQFDAPLIERLCGGPWLRREERTREDGVDPHHALWRQILRQELAELPDGLDNFAQDLFRRNFRRHASELDPDWPSNTDVPLDGAMDEALNRCFADSFMTLQEKGLFAEVDTDFDFGSETEAWNKAALEALRMTRREGLARLIAPEEGGRQLQGRPYDVGLVDLAEDLASWTKRYALPRAHVDSDLAATCLQLWLFPAACEDAIPALKVMANDPFVSRAIRYAALRYRANLLSNDP
jgi:hypothetical protein